MTLGSLTQDVTQLTEAANRQALPVLVVDDSRVARKIVENTLSEEQYIIHLAGTGREAVDLFAKYHPALVITDWLMPDLSGIELCQHIRSRPEGTFTYIILLTGATKKSDVVEGLQAGADDYLTKPFHPDELLARVAVGRRMIDLHREIEAKNHLLEQLARTDSLTTLPNRRAIEEWAPRQLSGALRHGFPIWTVMADLDHFKSINDNFGHDSGDVVLRKFSEILKINTRQCDMCARIGGEEFLLVISHSDTEGVLLAVERIREQIAAEKFSFNGRQCVVTASFGIASPRQGEFPDFNTLMVRADEALYAAKRGGRNRVELKKN
jgi:two-component system cell cycle response regulator